MISPFPHATAIGGIPFRLGKDEAALDHSLDVQREVSAAQLSIL
jgi:hypothetical protein